MFLPLVLGGRTEISTWIGEVGRTIIYTLVCSLFLSLTAIPLVLGRVLRASPAHRWTLNHTLRCDHPMELFTTKLVEVR